MRHISVLFSLAVAACVLQSCVLEEIKMCEDGQIMCNNTCIDPLTERTHCGALGQCLSDDPDSEHFKGTDCSASNMFCVDGKCGCSEDQVLCDGTCVDPNTSNNHCGAQGTCSSEDAEDENYRGQDCGDMRCDNKKCVCPNSYILCDNKCVNPLIDSFHCGAQGACTDEDANSDDFIGKKCGNLMCTDGECKCPDDFVQCNGSCIDPMHDVRYCGAKGQCNAENADDPDFKGQACQGGSMCTDGQCICPEGYILCNNRCIDPSADMEFCGAKGQCHHQDPNDANFIGQKCVGGTTCNGTACECPNQGILCNGKCILPQTDMTFCGAKGLCNHPDPNNENYIGQACVGGATCNGTSCECPNNGVLCDGKCINPLTDTTYCGANDACANYQTCPDAQTCEDGQCQCPPNTTLCGNECVSLEFNSEHCGSCHHACQSTESCVNKKCTVTNCNGANMEMCSVNGEFQCINISNDKKNCGRCGNICDPNQYANVLSGTCEDGECVYQCMSGYTPCNPAGTICLDTTSDVNNCGACNRKCNAGQKCQNGQCIDTCPNACQSTNGCINTAQACGSSCFNCYSVNTSNLQSASCTSYGQCQYTCYPGYEWNGSYCYYTGNCPDYYYNNGNQCVKNTNTSCTKTGKTLTFDCTKVKSSTGVCGPDGECECVPLGSQERYFCPMSDGHYCSTYCWEDLY